MKIKQNLIQSAVAALSGDRQLLRELARTFVEGAPELIEEFENAVLRKDHEAAQRAIHLLRWLSATLYANELIDFAIRFEHDLKNGKGDSNKCAGNERLKCSIAILMQELRRARYID